MTIPDDITIIQFDTYLFACDRDAKSSVILIREKGKKTWSMNIKPLDASVKISHKTAEQIFESGYKDSMTEVYLNNKLIKPAKIC